jgi:hypothetical protein
MRWEDHGRFPNFQAALVFLVWAFGLLKVILHDHQFNLGFSSSAGC